MTITLDRVGEIGFNKHGSKMIIERYNSYTDVWVKFVDSGNLVHTNYGLFKKGIVKNPYDRTVFGIGYIGEGKYKVSENGKVTKAYSKWSAMLKRCYKPEHNIGLLFSDGCEIASVCEKWHNFQNFADWFEDNYYEVDDQFTALDKDILVKGSRLYSPDTCIFVPSKINSMFRTKSDIDRYGLPYSVYHVKTENKYTSTVTNYKGERVSLKRFDTPEEAFQVYKTYRESYIKEVANKYRDQLPSKVYNALIDYVIEIKEEERR